MAKMNLREKLVCKYLPMWAKETVLYENTRLKKENEVLKQKYRELRAYVDGYSFGLRATKAFLMEDEDG